VVDRAVVDRAAAQLPIPLRRGALRPAPGFRVLDQRLRGTRFVALTSRSVLNPPAQTGMDFWSLNPYVGCEFGCTYCYARYAHRYVVERARDAGRIDAADVADYRGPGGWEAFERRIFVKANLPAVLDADLRRYHRAPQPAPIVIGTATDPYQPAERRFRLTRAALERLARYEGLSVGIITKSPLVARDVDLLARLQHRNAVEVYISLITTDAALLKRLVARSPMPRARLRAVERLARRGVNVGVIVAPVLPGITDSVPQLESLFRAARAAGARFVCAGPLRLYAGVRDRFLPVLDAHFPALASRYRRAYERQSAAPTDYARALARRVRRLQARTGFPVTRGMVDRYKRHLPALQGELGL
jgi:DNA repair photolyase